MASELSFLIDLLLNHKLSPKTKEHIATRIKEVELAMSTTQVFHTQQKSPVCGTVPNSGTVHGAQQAPSMLAIMAKHGMVGSTIETPIAQIAQLEPEPVAIIAQTPAAAAAMNARNQSIASQISGKPMTKGETKPRKW